MPRDTADGKIPEATPYDSVLTIWPAATSAAVKSADGTLNVD